MKLRKYGVLINKDVDSNMYMNLTKSNINNYTMTKLKVIYIPNYITKFKKCKLFYPALIQTHTNLQHRHTH